MLFPARSNLLCRQGIASLGANRPPPFDRPDFVKALEMGQKKRDKMGGIMLILSKFCHNHHPTVVKILAEFISVVSGLPARSIKWLLKRNRLKLRITQNRKS